MSQYAASARFAPSLPASVDARIDIGSLTSDGGPLWLHEAGAALGLCAALAAVIPFWRDTHVQHPVEVLIRQRSFQIAYGNEDQDDADTLRTDPLIRLVCGRLLDETDLASQPTTSRSENHISRRSCRDFASGCDPWAP